jgi:hypothetical protein
MNNQNNEKIACSCGPNACACNTAAARRTPRCGCQAAARSNACACGPECGCGPDCARGLVRSSGPECACAA